MKRKIAGLFIFVTFWSLSYSNSFAKEVTLIYTGGTHAMLYPCHCPIETDGGVARRATLIKQLRNNDPDIILLDSGNFFSSGLLDENTLNTQLDMQRAVVNLRAMELMKYDAINLGEDEFNFGEKFFGENADKFKLKFISTNLKSEKALPFIIKETAGIKFGIVGLTNSKVKAKIKDIKIIDYKVALIDALAQLKAQGVDFVVLLSNLGEETYVALINDVPGVDIVIDAQSSSKKETSFKIGKTIILRPTWQGRRLGKAVFNIQEKKIIDYKAEDIRLSDKISDAPEVLSILPRCFSDNECKKTGAIGACQDAGNTSASCSFKEAQKVPLTVVLPKDCPVCDTKPMVGFLEKKFAGLKVNYLYYPEKNALNLIKKLDISGLPVYILGKEVEKAEGFSDLKSSLEIKSGSYIVKPEAGGIAYFLKRKEIKGRLDIFISLFDKNTFKLLKVIEEYNPIIHFLVVKRDGKFEAPSGAPEIEEDLRALCVQKHYPDIFPRYISCRAKNISSSWWDDCLEGADIEKIKVCARGDEGVLLLDDNSKLNDEIKVIFGPTYLLDNKTIFSSNGVPAKEALKKIIKK